MKKYLLIICCLVHLASDTSEPNRKSQDTSVTDFVMRTIVKEGLLRLKSLAKGTLKNEQRSVYKYLSSRMAGGNPEAEFVFDEETCETRVQKSSENNQHILIQMISHEESVIHGRDALSPYDPALKDSYTVCRRNYFQDGGAQRMNYICKSQIPVSFYLEKVREITQQ